MVIIIFILIFSIYCSHEIAWFFVSTRYRARICDIKKICFITVMRARTTKRGSKMKGKRLSASIRSYTIWMFLYLCIYTRIFVYLYVYKRAWWNSRFRPSPERIDHENREDVTRSRTRVKASDLETRSCRKRASQVPKLREYLYINIQKSIFFSQKGVSNVF